MSTIDRASLISELVRKLSREEMDIVIEHIVPKGPIGHFTQVYIVRMHTQDEAVLPEAVSLFLQEF